MPTHYNKSVFWKSNMHTFKELLLYCERIIIKLSNLFMAISNDKYPMVTCTYRSLHFWRNNMRHCSEKKEINTKFVDTCQCTSRPSQQVTGYRLFIWQTLLSKATYK